MKQIHTLVGQHTLSIRVYGYICMASYSYSYLIQFLCRLLDYGKLCSLLCWWIHKVLDLEWSALCCSAEVLHYLESACPCHLVLVNCGLKQSQLSLLHQFKGEPKKPVCHEVTHNKAIRQIVLLLKLAC